MNFISNYRQNAREEMTLFIQGIIDDNKVYVEKIDPIVENTNVYVNIYLERRKGINVIISLK